MKRFKKNVFAPIFAVTLALIVVTIVAAPVQAQYGSPSIRNESGFLLSQGLFTLETAGSAIAAHEAVYMSASDGKVYKSATSAHTTDLYGIAYAACASGSTKCQIQVQGKAAAIADGTIATGDAVGAPTSTAGRVKSLSSTTASLKCNLVLGKSISPASITVGNPVNIFLTPCSSAATGTGTVSETVTGTGSQVLATSPTIAGLTTTGALTGASETLSSTLAVTGTTTPTGGIVPAAGGGAASGTTIFCDTGNPAAGTTGTNSAGIANQLWYTQCFVPHNVTITNIAFLCGGTCTTDKGAIGIFSTAGTLLACTATTAGGGTTLSGANTWQNYTLSASCPNGATTYPIVGPTHILVGVVTNGTTAGSIQTYPLANGPVCAVAGSQATLANFSPAVTKSAASCPYIVIN